jgi:hypothetical protein
MHTIHVRSAHCCHCLVYRKQDVSFMSC